MRHRHHKYSSFGLKPGPRKALLRGLVQALVEHERIKTTLPKARALRPLIERAVSLGKKQSLSSRRKILSLYPSSEASSKIFKNLSERFKTRQGGFTRIIKLGPRSGDKTEMAYLEFVDYIPSVKEKSQEDKKQIKKTKKTQYARNKKLKKRIRKIKQLSRRTNRT